MLWSKTNMEGLGAPFTETDGEEKQDSTGYYRCHKSIRMDIFDVVTLSCGNVVYNNLS